MKHKFLVVDDDVTVLRVATEVLTHYFDCEVDPFSDPAEALHRFLSAKETYSLVICDLNMPQMNGIMLCRLIKKERENIPIVILTAFSSETAYEEASSIGVSEFVQKPFKTQALVELIGKLLVTPDKRTGRMKGFENQFWEQVNLILDGKIPAGFSSPDFIVRALKKNNYEPEKVAKMEKMIPLLKTEIDFLEARDNYLYLKTLQDQRVGRIRMIIRSFSGE
ncbi:MAG: response regulator [Kiritimatiellae bacterium]|nr:response regulator [Kiritimatiellia bacterium]